jgi:hypothetical protein
VLYRAAEGRGHVAAPLWRPVQQDAEGHASGSGGCGGDALRNVSTQAHLGNQVLKRYISAYAQGRWICQIQHPRRQSLLFTCDQHDSRGCAYSTGGR